MLLVNGSIVLGFDHDGPEVFDELVSWIESVRLEYATLQILTPYPGTPLFRRLEAEGRILHRRWELYDTAHAVFRPRRMSPEQLEEGYARCHERLFSWSSIWARRPRTASAVPAYLAMTTLYKRSNRLWAFLIRHRLVATAWRPLVELSRRRQLRWRRQLARLGAPLPGAPAGSEARTSSCVDVFTQRHKDTKTAVVPRPAPRVWSGPEPDGPKCSTRDGT